MEASVLGLLGPQKFGGFSQRSGCRAPEQPARPAAIHRNLRRSIRMLELEVENCRARHRHAAGNAMVARPGSITVLQIQNLLDDLRMPLLPLCSATSLQAVTHVEIREKLFSADGAKAFHKPRIAKFGLDLFDLARVLLSIGLGSAQLFESLCFLVKRDAGCR